MISIALVMALVGVGIALIIGILIFSSVESAIDCPIEGQEGFEECNRAKSIAWVVISVLPIAMFFALFTIFGGITDELPDPRKLLKFFGMAKHKTTNSGLLPKGIEPQLITKPKNGIGRQILLLIGLAKRK